MIELLVDSVSLTKALILSKKVFEDKKSFGDKFFNGREFEADLKGFLAEFLVCNYFSYPEPELLKGKNDDFDLIVNNKKVDVKCSFNCLINCNQFFRKKPDVFLFCFFKGNFVEREFVFNGRKEVFLCPEENKCKLIVLGWIEYSKVEANSKLLYVDSEDIESIILKSHKYPCQLFVIDVNWTKDKVFGDLFGETFKGKN